MKASTYTRIGTMLAVASITMAGCSNGSGGDAEIGYLSLGISDAPVHDAVKVCIAFDEIEFKGPGAPFSVELGGVQNINLLDFQGANAAPVLFNEPMPAGEYQWMRLGVIANRGGSGGLGDDPASDTCAGGASYIVFENGNTHNLYIPSGSERGLQLNGEFIITADQVANFTVEVDLMKSLATPPGLDPDMIYRPTMKLVNNLEAGILLGRVAPELATAIDPETEAACEPTVMVFDDGVTPNAYDPEVEDALDAIASAMVNPIDNGDGTTSYAYSIGFLEAGNYEVAFTCDGLDFTPVEGKAAEIFAEELTQVDFP